MPTLESLIPKAWLLLLPLVFWTPVYAQPDGGPRIATTTVEPWGFYSPDGQATGMLVDFLSSLFSRAGLPFNNTLQPYPRVIHALASGQADLAVLFKSPEADQIAFSLGTVMEAPIVIVMRAQDHRPITRLADFHGMKVGQVRGSRYGPAFDNDPDFEHISVADVAQGLRMLTAGRFDAMASTKHSLLYALHQTGIAADSLTIALPLFNAQADLYVSLAARDRPWVKQLSRALAAMRADGSLKPSFYQTHYWPYDSHCFAGGQCIDTH